MHRKFLLSPACGIGHYFVRGISLISLNTIQVLFPLLRTLILARVISSFEFGFASALSASYSTFELITDIAIHRFVFASSRDEYSDALAGAHGLSIVRGVASGLLAFAAAPGLAYMMSLPADWTSFAWLGLAIFIRSFEHFEVRVAERDYRYGAQFILNFASSAIALLLMITTWLFVKDHRVYLAMLFAQNISYTIASHWLAKSPYRVDFRSSHFRKAARFAYPLIFSGLGLAAISQGDRLLVGSVLDLPTLGIYSVMMLAVTVPIGAINRIFSSLVLAGLHNVVSDRQGFQCRLLLYLRISLILGVGVAFGILAFMNIFVPFVFGSRFDVPGNTVALLAAVSFLNIARSEPTTSALLVNHRTDRLPILSLSTVVGLVAATVLALIYRTLYAVVLGRLIGELFTSGVTMAILRSYIRDFRWHPFIGILWAGCCVVAGCVFQTLYPLAETSSLRLGVFSALIAVSVGALVINLRSMAAEAYGRRRDLTSSP